MTVSLRAGAATDTGLVRRNNQDQLLIEDGLFAVADGMGGHAGGEVASLIAVEALRAAFGDASEGPHRADDLRDAVRWANRTVYQRAQEGTELRGMGTTLTAAALVVEDGEERLAIANVGDSRAYVFVGGELTQLTEDHSVPEELVRQGQLEPQDVATHPQRHILTRAVGISPDVEVDLWDVLPFAGDRILLCSDGLPRELTDEQIASVLRRLADPAEAASELVSRARASGGADNITAVVIDVVDDDDRARAASAALANEAAGLTAAPVEVGQPSEPAAPSPSPAAVAAASEPTAPAAPPAGPSPSRRRRLTLRVVGFLVLLLLVLGAAAGATYYYARQTFYVGLGDSAPQSVVIYRGRPGGVLWFKPTVAVRPAVTTNDVLPSRVPDLRRGKIWASLADARAYVDRLVREAGAITPSAGTTAP